MAESSDKEDSSKDAILANHPLYPALTAKHATSMMPLGDANTASSLGSDTINVTIHSLSAASCTVAPISKRLPASLVIGRLKQMCKRVFKLDIDLQILHYKADKQSMLVALDDDDNSLAYFGVSDGAEIYMNEIDMKAKRREEENVEKERREQMEEQEERGEGMRKLQLDSVEQEKKAVAAAGNK